MVSWRTSLPLFLASRGCGRQSVAAPRLACQSSAPAAAVAWQGQLSMHILRKLLGHPIHEGDDEPPAHAEDVRLAAGRLAGAARRRGACGLLRARPPEVARRAVALSR